MSKVVGIRLAPWRFEDLQRAARATGRTPSDWAGRLVEEGLRQQEFPGIVFRDTPIGRQAFIAGSRLSVWHIALIAPEYDPVAAAIAAIADLPTSAVVTALAYATGYPDEIAVAIADSAALKRRVATLMAARGDAA